MTSYNEMKSKAIIEAVLEILQHSDVDIDNTITV
ncbi:hypothetical protein EZS27_018470 [termite gut metagenome]|uniref:Uncharacterized protein n=1 Tax=termite gut metagenome TaxID=433724 RepID=A0A5J4RG66_9ZZZZ